jgi:hypothetical protein
VAARAAAAGGTAGAPEDIPYGRMATVTDPFGTEFSVIAEARRAAGLTRGRRRRPPSRLGL